MDGPVAVITGAADWGPAGRQPGMKAREGDMLCGRGCGYCWRCGGSPCGQAAGSRCSPAWTAVGTGAPRPGVPPAPSLGATRGEAGRQWREPQV